MISKKIVLTIAAFALLVVIGICLGGCKGSDSGTVTPLPPPVKDITGPATNWPEATLGDSGHTIRYPTGWSAETSDSRVIWLVQFERDGTEVPDRPFADVSVIRIDNPEKIPMEEFFGSGGHQIEYFNDAAKIEDISIGGLAAKKFLSVAGLDATDVVVIPFDDHFVVIEDIAGSGLFDDIVNSFRE